MLVLSLKVGQRIQIGPNVYVEIRKVAGSQVRLAIDAPKDVRVLRTELPEQEQEAKQ